MTALDDYLKQQQELNNKITEDSLIKEVMNSVFDESKLVEERMKALQTNSITKILSELPNATAIDPFMRLQSSFDSINNLSQRIQVPITKYLQSPLVSYYSSLSNDIRRLNLWNTPKKGDDIQREKTAYEQRRLSSHSLTDAEIESLIYSISKGKNTYKNLRQTINHLNSATLCNYLSDRPQSSKSQAWFYQINFSDAWSQYPHYFCFETVPDFFCQYYEFKDTDVFKLSVSGENYLRKMKNVRKQKRQYWFGIIIVPIIVSIVTYFIMNFLGLK